MANIAKRTASGAYLTHNHKSCGAIAKTFMKIRAGGFFAHSGHFVAAQNIFDLLYFWRSGQANTHPLRFALNSFSWNNLNWNALHLIGTAQFLTLL